MMPTDDEQIVMAIAHMSIRLSDLKVKSTKIMVRFECYINNLYVLICCTINMYIM